jgi:hypothetical protein
MLGLSDLTEEKIILKMGAVGAQAWLLEQNQGTA